MPPSERASLSQHSFCYPLVLSLSKDERGAGRHLGYVGANGPYGPAGSLPSAMTDTAL